MQRQYILSINRAAAAAAAILTAAVLSSVPTYAQAEEGRSITSGHDESITCDPDVIKGQLENGLTYYIRHNANPSGCADFYIVHNVGALQEEDSQDGLAHFLEHMAFNGTRHYPDKGILEFLAREGVRFGSNINAYTTRTETVYNLSGIPLVRESFIDSVLTVLHDWSCDILCEQDAIDAERGVIREEWRRRDNVKTRMFEQQSRLIYTGARQSARNVIGSIDVIENFRRDEILDFYRTWYRPDLQAVIIVGDVDPEEMESKVVKRFSDIPAPENPKEKDICPVPPLEKPLFTYITDPDIHFVAFKAIHRQNYPSSEERGTEFFIRDRLMRQIITEVLASRLEDKAMSEGSPVKRSVLVTYPSGTDFYISQFTLLPQQDTGLADAMRFYRTETERILRYGISEDEFNRAKFKVLRKERLDRQLYPEDVTDKMLVSSYISDFLNGIPYVFPVMMQDLERRILEDIHYEDSAHYIDLMFGSGSEKIFFCNANSEKTELLPGKDIMEEILCGATDCDIRPEFPETDRLDTSIETRAGKILSAKEDRSSGLVNPGHKEKTCRNDRTDEIWTLENGIKVYWTPSHPVDAFRHLDIILDFNTGYKVLPEGKEAMGKAALSYISRNIGFRDADLSAVNDSPECSGVSISFRSGQEHAYVMMSSDSTDMEKGFRLLYLHLTEPYFSSETTLAKFSTDNITSLRNRDKDAASFNDAVRKVYYNGHPWMEPADSSDFKALDMDFIREMFYSEYCCPDHMTAYICSDMDKDTIKALVCRYLAALPSPAETDMRYGAIKKDARISAAKASYRGKTTIDSTYRLKTVPKSSVQILFRGQEKIGMKNIAAFAMLDHIMSMRYLASIREEYGGTYSVSFSTEFSPEEKAGGKRPVARSGYESTVSFRTRPELKDILIDKISDELDSMAINGPGRQEMENAAKYLIKRHNEKLKAQENSVSALNRRRMQMVKTGFGDESCYEAAVLSVRAGDIRRLASKIMRSHRLTTVYSENGTGI